MIGEILIKHRFISPERLDEALAHQAKHGGRIGSNLVDLGLMLVDDVARVLGVQHGVPAASEHAFVQVDPAVTELVRRPFAEMHGVIPLAVDGETLHMAMRDPHDITTLDQLEAHLGFNIRPYATAEFRLLLYLQRYYQIPWPNRYLLRGGDREETGAEQSTPIQVAAVKRDVQAPPAALRRSRTGGGLLPAELNQQTGQHQALNLRQVGQGTSTRNKAVRGTSAKLQPGQKNPSPPSASQAPGSQRQAARQPEVERAPAGRRATPLSQTYTGPIAHTPMGAAPHGQNAPSGQHPAQGAAPTGSGWERAVAQSSAGLELPDPEEDESVPELFFLDEVSRNIEPVPQAPAEAPPQAPPQAPGRVGSQSFDSEEDDAFDLDIDIEMDIDEDAEIPKAMGTPVGVAELVGRLRQAEDREAVIGLLLQPILEGTTINAILLPKGELACGLAAVGTEVERTIVKQMMIPLSAPSLLSEAFENKEVVRGPADPFQQMIASFLRGPAPKEACVTPICLKNKVINLLCTQSDGELPEDAITELEEIASEAAAAFRRIIIRRRKSS